jgi:DNA-directed RNA polymerase subunit RPC12/RpoP
MVQIDLTVRCPECGKAGVQVMPDKTGGGRVPFLYRCLACKHEFVPASQSGDAARS